MTDDKTALELRNFTQRWVLSKPVVTIEGKSYQVDSSCSVVVNELGKTSCDILPASTDALPAQLDLPNYVIGTAAAAGAILMLIISVVTIVVICTVCKNRSKKFNIR